MNESNSKKKSGKITNINAITSEKNETQLILLFKQLTTFFNYRRKYRESLEKGYYISKYMNDKEQYDHFIQNEFCLIEREWIERWKKHVGYNEIIFYCNNNNIRRDLNESDYPLIIPFIIKNAKNNSLPLLDNRKIYNENEDKINPYVYFEIIDKDCYNSFISLNDKSSSKEDEFKARCFPVKISEGKIILMLDLLTHLKMNKIHILIFY